MRIREQILRQWLWRLPPGNGEVALTFDDGPDPASTPRLLAALREHDMRSTMFVVARQCEKNPSLVSDCVANGHVLALHGFTHESFFWHSRGWQRAGIERGSAILSDLNLPFQRLFRPPFGRFNPCTARALRDTGFRGVMWSQMPGDWRDQSPNRLLKNLIDHLHDGSILVLHDRPQTIENVIACLPFLASEVRRRGWQFGLLSHPLSLPIRSH